MTDIVTVKGESDTMKGSEADIKDNTAVEHFLKSESHEQSQGEKDERCTHLKNDLQVRDLSPNFSLSLMYFNYGHWR